MTVKLSKINTRLDKYKIFVPAFVLGMIFAFVFGLSNVSDVSAKASTIDVTIPPVVHLTTNTSAVSSNGTFITTNSGSIGIKTDNYTGYTLKLAGSGSNYDKLVNSSDNTKTITSIASAISSATFSGTSGTTYNNKWGYLPSKFNSAANSNYRPAPSTSGDTIDATSAANSTNNTYSVTVGARLDSGTKAGTYTGTILVVPVANPVAYAITYNSNTTATVTNMPSNVSSTTSSETITLSSNTPTRAGYTFAGWNTKSDGTGTNYSAGGTWTLDQTASSNTLTLYAKWTPKTYTATIYYNNKTSSGTVGTTNITNTGSTVQCTVANVAGTCSPTIPTTVTSSVGTYNNAYVGLASGTGTMSSTTSITLSGNATFYAVYRSSVDIVNPTSTSAASKTTVYRNQWFTSNSALSSTVLSTTTTGTTTDYSQATTVATSYSFAGYAGAASTNTISSACYSSGTTAASCTTVARLTLSALTKAWAVYTRSYSAIFYYNNNTTPTAGTSSVVATNPPISATQYLRPTSDSASGLYNSNYQAPTGHYGTYNNALVGWATATGTMSTVTPSTPSTGPFYAVYSTDVTNYYYTGSAYSSRTLHRNQTLSSTSAMGTTYLSTSTTGLSNYSTAAGPGSSTFAGFASSLGSTAVASGCSYQQFMCATVAAAAGSTHTTLNTIYSFRQNFSMTGSTGVSAIGTTLRSCNVSSTSTTAGGTSCTVTTPSITVDTGYTSLGWGAQGHTSAGTAAGATITLTSSGGTLYANAKLGTFSLIITTDLNVSSMSVKTGSTSGAITNCPKAVDSSYRVFACQNLTYGVNYYLFPVFESGYEFDSWTKTDSATNAQLGSTTTENTYYRMGNGQGALTLATRESAPYMQDVTYSDLDMLMPNDGDDYILKDNRDDNEYAIARIDNQFWMATNLALEGPIQLTSDDTNISTSLGYYNLPTSSENGFVDYDDENDYNAGWGVPCSSSDPCYGYYTFGAATAGTGMYEATGNTQNDICPKGWRLPTQTEYENLISTYTTGEELSDGPFYAEYSGVYDTGQFVGQNSGEDFGAYWTSTINGEFDAIQLNFTQNAAIVWNVGKNTGASIRCVKKETMQQVTVNQLSTMIPSTGDTAILSDERDGELYTVGRLADGKFWMLDNLRLGSSSTMALTPADTNITSNYTLPASGAANFDSTNGWTNAAINIDSKNTTTTSYGAGSGKIGTYYNFCAASAGTYCYASGAGTGNATQDICPKGWRMPTGGDSGEYQALYTAYSSNDTNFMNALSTPLSGSFFDGSASYQGEDGSFWSSTYYSGGSMHGLYVASSYVGPSLASYRYGGSSVRCVAKIPYMQDQTTATLNAMMPNAGDTATLYDKRDYEPYLVGKLADGKFWMLDNLRLGSTSTMALTPADTNITSNYTLPASGTANFDTTNGYTNAAINIDSKNTTTTSYGAGSGKIGTYYNFCAASAGTYCYAYNAGTGNATQDICPKGWRMPTGGSSGEYKALYTAYSSDATNFKNALSTPLSGYFSDGSASYQGTYGYFWSSTYRNGVNMYSLYVYSSGVSPSISSSRYSGNSIRCLQGS